jgi:hypothetical protein
MIQRIQHVFMALSGFCSLYQIRLLFDMSEFPYGGWILTTNILLSIFVFVNIFLYKKLQIQKTIQFVHLMVADIMLVLNLLLCMQTGEWMPFLKYLIAVVLASVFSGLAFVFVVKDIQLLKSVDKIR